MSHSGAVCEFVKPSSNITGIEALLAEVNEGKLLKSFFKISLEFRRKELPSSVVASCKTQERDFL